MNTRKFVLQARNLLKLTAKKLAEKLEVDTRTIYRWETGETEPSGSKVLQIIMLCKEQGIELDDLVFLWHVCHCYCHFCRIQLLQK